MAIYWFDGKYVSRRQGRSFTSAAAYRSGQKLYCIFDERTHDYSRRRDVVCAEILLPESAPREYLDFQTFCDAVESAEKRKDARTAREIVIALPRELSITTNIILAKEFANRSFVAHGMCAALAVHRGDDKKACALGSRKPHCQNPHTHILLTTRPVGPDGFGKLKNRDWDKRDYFLRWRKEWADIQNKFLTRKGLSDRVSHESYLSQGIGREPTFHLGPVLSAMERRGIKTHLGELNRAIEQRNRERELPELAWQMEHDDEHEQEWSR